MRPVGLIAALVAATGCNAAGTVIGEQPFDDEGAGGQRSPAPSARRMKIVVARALSTEMRGGDELLEGVDVFSNDELGNLVAHALSGPGGVAWLDVIDGGFVSVAMPDPNLKSPTAAEVLVTARILPDVQSLRIPIVRDERRLEPATMTVDVVWPEVPGAGWYTINLDCNGPIELEAPAETKLTIGGYQPCKGAHSFSVVVESQVDFWQGGPSAVHEVGWKVDVPFVAAQSAVVEIDEMVPNQMAALTINGLPADQVDFTTFRLGPNGLVLGAYPRLEAKYQEGGHVVVALTAPDLPEPSIVWTQGRAGPPHGCGLDWSRISEDLEPAIIDPFRLAKGVEAAPGTWQLGPGDLGDVIRLQRYYVLGSQLQIDWALYEPAAKSGTSPPILEIPAQLEPFFFGLAEITEDPSPAVVDILEADGLVEFLELYQSRAPHQTEARAWDCLPADL